MAALVQGPPYSGEWTLDTRFHCQAWQWPWKPGSTVKPQPQFLEWPWKPGSTVNPHPHSDPGNQIQLWTPTPTVTLETRFNCETPASVPTVTLETKSQDVHVGISTEYISSQEKDADEQFSICDHLWWFGYELSAGNQVSSYAFSSQWFHLKSP